MKRFLVPLAAVLVTGFVFAQDTTLTAIRVGETSLDINADYWADAPVLEVATVAAKEGEPDGPVVSLQAAYDGEFLTIRAEWADDTESVFHNGWTFDGSTFTKGGNEDRIMYTFPIQNNPEFASKGCTVACHNDNDDEEEWWMGSDSDDVTYDVWHWKASRTNPAGYADDKWWGPQTDPTVYGKGSRHGDAKESGSYTSNANEDSTAPLMMSVNGPNLPVMAGEEMPVDTALLKAGDIIPGEILARPIGSRGDVDANGVWQDGKWVVVMRRALDTGNPDDIVFRPGRRVPFGMAVLDNAGGDEHHVDAEVLILDWRR